MKSDYNLESILNKLKSREKDLRNFSPLPTDSLPYISQVVEGLSPITEVRDKGGMSTRLDTPGAVPNKDQQIREWQHLMLETRPGAEFEGELFFRNGPRDQWGYDELFDKMNEAPEAMADISYLEGEANPDTLAPLKDLEVLEEVKSPLDKELEKKMKETVRKKESSEEIDEVEVLDKIVEILKEGEKVASLVRTAQEEGGEGEGGGDPFADLLGGGEGGGLDLGGGDLGGGEGLGGGLDLGLGGEGGGFDLGLGEEVEEKRKQTEVNLFTDINPQILENLDEQSKRALVKALSDLKVVLASPIEDVSVSQIKSIFNEIISLVNKAKEKYREKLVGAETDFDKQRIENVNKYIGASYNPVRRFHPDTYYLINVYNEISKLGVRIDNLYVLEKDNHSGVVKVAVTITAYAPNPMQSEGFKSKRIPLIVVYDAVREKPIKLSTIGGRELEFTRDCINQLIQENKYPVDFFFGYYNPQFMKKKK